ncbi:MAG: DUF4437 domain-containing protein, partial [Myxococcota bacterium]
MKIFPSLALALVATACAGSQIASPTAESAVPTAEPTAPTAEPTTTMVSASEVEWEQLNPARGENSPKAATLWGERTGPGPSGFLLRPVDGFS